MSDRKELLRTVEEQQQQLNRYQKKLRDVVAAYKSIVKEKEALEASLKVLNENDASSSNSSTANVDASSTNTVSDTISRGQRDIEQQPQSSGSDLQVQEHVASEEDKQESADQQTAGRQLKDKVSTLTRALATLTEERSRTEANHQADKKKLRQERDELEESLKREKSDAARLRQHLDEKTTEFRNKLRSHQVEREKEENNHAIMMRELQTLVAIERSEKEKFENQCDDLQRHLSDRRNAAVAADECEAYRRQIGDLSDELRSVRSRLRAAEEQASRPQPLLLELQREMTEMKSQNREAVLQERKRANEAEERLREIARMSEERVAGLEAKLSELSETVGTYDRTRQQDKQAIQRLKERVTQLDIENMALLNAAEHSNLDDVDNDDDLNLDVQGLLQKMIKLKGLLKVANNKSQNPVDLEEILQREGLSADTDRHGTCKEELLALKEEFERYKFRAQSMLKSNRSSSVKAENDPSSSSSRDMESTLKAHVAEMRTKIRNLSDELELSEERSARRAIETEEELTRVKAKCARELAKQESEFRVKVAELDNQMQKQRQRTLTLLEEKDAEIRSLKISLGITKPKVKEKREKENDQQGEHEEAAGSTHDDEMMILTFTEGHKDDGRLLHYVQEMAKKDAEVSGLRKSKHQLESAVRELQASIAAQEERHGDEMDGLRAEIGRLQRNRSRELGANLEYLKNVVLRYMLSSDSNSRHHMLNAIATMLEFSPKEVDSVRLTHSSASWWPRAPHSSMASNAPMPPF